MKTSVLRYLVAALASLGMVESHSRLPASENSAVRPTLSPGGVLDVRLGNNDSLSGYLVNHDGAPVTGAIVSLRQSGRILSSTATDARGAFRIEPVPGGVYDLAVSRRSQPIRVWTASSAPPTAQSAAVFVVAENVVRGQSACDEIPCDELVCDDCCYYEPPRRKNYLLGRDGLLWGATAVTGLVLGAVALGEIGDLNDQLDQMISP